MGVYMNLINLIDDEAVEIVRNDYKYTAICTSDVCRLRITLKSGKVKISDEGVPKAVPKSVDQCPDCGTYLFWSRT